MTSGRTVRSSAGMLILALALAAPARAEFVTLRTRDGSVAITGQLAGFADGTYTLSTNIGIVSLPAAMVECVGEGCPVLPDDDLRLVGSAALSDRLVPSLLAAFAADRGGGLSWRTPEGDMAFALKPEAEIGDGAAVVASGGNAAGLDALLSRRADFALLSRRAFRSEAEEFAAAGQPGLREWSREYTAAFDALVFSVHPANPVTGIGVEDAARVLSGAIREWGALGGRPAPLVLYVSVDGSGSREMAADLLLDPRGLALSDAAVVLESDEAVGDAVRADPHAFGLTGIAQGTGTRLAVGGTCGLETSPTPFAIRTGDYPLARPLFLYGGTAPSTVAREFLEFAVSPDGQAIASGSGLVPLAFASRSAAGEGLRLAAALEAARTPGELAGVRDLAILLLSAERLGATFRFEPGSAQLDPLSQADLFRLAARLTEIAPNREVVFLGFSASTGDAGADLARSRERAERVRGAVSAAWTPGEPEPRSRAVGFGHIFPVTCDEESGGNDRVEVWLRRLPADGGS